MKPLKPRKKSTLRAAKTSLTFRFLASLSPNFKSPEERAASEEGDKIVLDNQAVVKATPDQRNAPSKTKTVERWVTTMWRQNT